jgi:predicted flap endonuclease-1-like 5' DNA nuclease
VDAVLDPDSPVTVDGVPNTATSLDEIPDDPDEADPDPADPTDWAGLDHDGFAEAYDRGAADETAPLVLTDADAGASASAMEVEKLPDGTEAYVTNYGDGAISPGGLDEVGEADPELYERERATYRFLRATGNEDHVSPHAFAGEEGDRAWSASRESPGDSAWESSGSVDREAYVDAAAAQLIAGNNDLHGQNIRVTEDGEFAFIDIDHSAGRLDEPDPGGSYPDNRTRALDQLRSTGSNVVEDSDGLEDAIVERAREKALELEEGDGDGFEPETSMEENIAANIDQLAAEARERGLGDGDGAESDDSGSESGGAPEPPAGTGAGGLPDVRGLGAATAGALRGSGFTEPADIEDATTEDLEAVDGVGPTLAQRLQNGVGGDGPAESPVDISEEAFADVDAVLSGLEDRIPDSPEEVSESDPDIYDVGGFDEETPLLDESIAGDAWDELRSRGETPAEREAVDLVKDRLADMKASAYADHGQAAAKAFDEALGGLPGALRNEVLDGDDPSEADVWAAERVAALHQRLAERLYGDEIEAYRGIRGFGAANVGIAAITQLDSDEESLTFAENKFANYTPSEDVAQQFDEGFIVQRDISPDEIVHFNDITNANNNNYKNESEIAPTTGETEIAHADIQVRQSAGAESESFFNADPQEMSSSDRQAWMDTLREIRDQQLKQIQRGDTDEPDTDLYAQAREGASDEALSQLEEIVRASDSGMISVPSAAREAVREITGNSDL